MLLLDEAALRQTIPENFHLYFVTSCFCGNKNEPAKQETFGGLIHYYPLKEVTMNSNMPTDPQFVTYYQKHQKCLKLNGLQPKTIEAYSRAIRRIGNYFDCRIDSLSSGQLLDYFTELLDTHSWSAVKLDLYGLKFFYAQRRCTNPGRISP